MVRFTVQALKRLLALLAVTGALTQGASTLPEAVQETQFPWYAALIPATASFQEDLYLGSNAVILMETHEDGDGRLSSAYTLAEIYLPNVRDLKTYYMDSPDNGIGEIAAFSTICRRVGAAFAVNGDYYVNQGVTAVRNGTIINSCVSSYDLCVLYSDGLMNTYRAGELRSQEAVNKALNGAWQAWSFGPVLLNPDGSAITDFSDRTIEYLTRLHPRTAIGYYGPGHYCLVSVAGYGEETPGVTLEELSAFFASLGCSKAYNLDGGYSTHMWFHGGQRTYTDKSRALSDIIYIEDLTGGDQP